MSVANKIIINVLFCQFHSVLIFSCLPCNKLYRCLPSKYNIAHCTDPSSVLGGASVLSGCELSGRDKPMADRGAGVASSVALLLAAHGQG